jgi:hypothetical protein
MRKALEEAGVQFIPENGGGVGVKMSGSNIVAAINAAHVGVEAAKREGTRFAIEAGRLLSQARDTVPHGGWDAWIKANCTMSPRTAQLYMKLARYVGGDPAKARRVANLRLRDAAREVAKLRRPSQSTARDVADTSELLALWGESSPTVRRRFAQMLHDDGQITPGLRDALLAAADLTPEQATEDLVDKMVLSPSRRLVMRSGSTTRSSVRERSRTA